MMVVYYPTTYHDRGFSKVVHKSGLCYSAHPYEERFYPQISAIDYRGFIDE
jgi:hypothetical protein